MIRPFTPSDASACVFVTHRALKSIHAAQYPEHVISEMIQSFDEAYFLENSQHYELFVYDVLGILATIALDVEKQEIKEVFVDPDYVGQGIGSQMLAHIEDRARKRGIDELFVQANLDSVEFYQKHKYVFHKHLSDELYGKTALFSKQL